jgi:hypothetical protein
MLFLLPRPASSPGTAALRPIGSDFRLVSTLHVGRALPYWSRGLAKVCRREWSEKSGSKPSVSGPRRP